MTASDGPVYLVTGSSRGLGRATAECLALQGARVHVVTRDLQRGEELEPHFPGRTWRLDVGAEGAAQRLVGEVLELDGRLDAVVHGVGPYLEAPLEGTAPSDFRELMEGNLFSAVALVDAARPALRAARGRVVLFGVAGLARQRPRRTNAAYTACKAALASYARSLALQEAPQGVTVNLVSPGVVPHAHASSDTLDPKVQAQVPMGRAGRPEEVAGAVAYLLSPEAAHVTGQDLEVAGGYMM